MVCACSRGVVFGCCRSGSSRVFCSARDCLCDWFTRIAGLRIAGLGTDGLVFCGRLLLACSREVALQNGNARKPRTAYLFGSLAQNRHLETFPYAAIWVSRTAPRLQCLFSCVEAEGRFHTTRELYPSAKEPGFLQAFRGTGMHGMLRPLNCTKWKLKHPKHFFGGILRSKK